MSVHRVDRARRYGFHARDVPQRRFSVKPGSHDDGPEHGMFLGPIGGPAFSRDLYGRFSRWHLQPGMHLPAAVDPAFLAIRWTDPATSGGRCVRLRREDAAEHEVAALHPLSHEIFTFDEAPFRATLTAFSPLVPGDEEAAALPVVVFSVEVEPLTPDGELPALDVAAFWPNLNGWRASPVTSEHRGDVGWPGHGHAGNVNVHTQLPGGPGTCVVQSRRPVVAAPEDVCGEVAVAVSGDVDAFSRQVQFSLYPFPTGVPPAEQLYTFDAVYDAFARTGRLGVTPDGSWEAHWHEPIGSAVAAHLTVHRPRAVVRFVVAFDWPVVRFGAGRCWYRPYTRWFPETTHRATRLAAVALTRVDAWLAALDAWQETTLDALTGAGWPPEVAGCVVNELNLTVSLGTAWVHGNPDGHRPPGFPAEHLGILEGFDTGYFYYDTSDLWHYAFPALSRTWPRLADLVFDELGRTLEAEVPVPRPIYRLGQTRPLLVAGKLPHDLGGAAEDPFVRVNGYAMRDDPNTWRDSNPAFVLAVLAHHRLLGRPLDATTWRRLAAAAELVAEQAGSGNGGVPKHAEFGDSTWDNLGLRGYSTYTAALCAGMWGVLARHSRSRGEDPSRYSRYEGRLDSARAVLDELWTGSFFRAASEGRYARAVMGDSLMGLFYADVCGVPDIVAGERVAAHLRTAYQLAHLGYHGGAVGPLLVAEELTASSRSLLSPLGGYLRSPVLADASRASLTVRYQPEHGQELQVNEVLVGSGWLLAAMLARYGLEEEARAVARSLRDALYGSTGLQFRTPAAIDAEGRFRAPLNMRPLAIWWLGTFPMNEPFIG